jgi:hypothetical protein
MADLLHHLETRATLIIDAPPLLPVTDAAVITQLAGGAIIVLAAGKTRREHVRSAASSIDSVGGRILGLVMNMASSKGPDAHRYGYAYGFEYAGNAGRTFDDHPPVVPAGLGGLPGVNGSSTPVMPEPGKTQPKPAADQPGAPASSDSQSTGAMPAAAKPTAVRSPAKSGAAKAPEPKPVVTRQTAPAVEESKPNGLKPSPAAPSPPPGDSARSAERGLPDPKTAADSVLSSVSAPLVRSTPTTPPPPAPAPRGTPSVSPFDSDTVLPGEPWQPPRPRPAFDPLTAPLDEIESGD